MKQMVSASSEPGHPGAVCALAGNAGPGVSPGVEDGRSSRPGVRCGQADAAPRARVAGLPFGGC